MNLIGNHIAIAYDRHIELCKNHKNKTSINEYRQWKVILMFKGIYSRFIFKNENSVNWNWIIYSLQLVSSQRIIKLFLIEMDFVQSQ